MSLEDRFQGDPPSPWRPDQDDADTIIGVVTGIDRADGDWGPYPIVFIRQDNGTEKSVHAFRSVLKSELQKKQPQIGERIGIKYLGEVKGANRSYIGYRVELERANGATFDWNSLGNAPLEDSIGRVVYDEKQDPVTVPAEAGDDDLPF